MLRRYDHPRVAQQPGEGLAVAFETMREARLAGFGLRHFGTIETEDARQFCRQDRDFRGREQIGDHENTITLERGYLFRR